MADSEPKADVEKQDKTEDAEEYTSNYSPYAVVTRLIVFALVCGMVQLFAFLGSGDKDVLLGFGSNLSILQTTGTIAVLIQIIVFIPSFIYQSEKYYDLTGSLTYITCVLYTFFAGRAASKNEFSSRAAIATGLVLLWCVRLGYFLFRRVLRVGKDSRFDVFKVDFFRYLNVWAIQGLWVFLTAYCAFIINADQRVENSELVVTDFIGIAVWVIGFVIEVVADYQKQFWRERENKRYPFIDSGLWYYSRHPNYFGEMVLWWGMFILSIEVLDGTQLASVVSPIFVFLLINFLSGVPILEKSSDKRHGHLDAYWEYKRNTSSLIPLPRGICGDKKAGPSKEEED